MNRPADQPENPLPPAGGEPSGELFPLRLMVDAIPAAIYLCRNDDRYSMLYLNDAMESLTGYRKEEFLSGRLSFVELYHPDDLSGIVAEVDRAVAAGEVFALVYRLRRRDGQWRWIEEFGRAVPPPAGRDEPLLVGVLNDITRRRRTEEALRLSEANYRAIFNAVNDAIFVHESATGGILDVNEAACRLFGYSREDMLHLTVGDMSAPDGPFNQEEALRVIARAGRGETQLFEWHSRARDGRLFWTEVNLKRAVIAGRESVLACVRDISDRKRAEQALRESERLYRGLIETSPDGIMLTDPELRILIANRQMAVLQGYEHEQDLVGQLVPQIAAPGDREHLRAVLAEAAASGRPRTVQIDLLRRDGSRCRSEVTVSARRDADDRPAGLLCTVRDITERERLLRQIAQAERLESIATLAGGVAHDFNNLLAVILGNATVTLRDPSLPPRVRELLSDVVTAAERGSALTRQLLACARTGLQRTTPTDLNAIVRHVVQVLRQSAADAGVTFSTDPGPEPMLAAADPTQIEQVVMNLCLNAVQASPRESTVLIRTRAACIAGEQESDPPPGSYVVLEVQDRGHGIDPALRDRIFDPFFTTKATGRGMGLAAALGIVRNHGGRILVDSAVGRGTTMSVWLPMADAEARTPEVEPALHPPPLPRGDETVLLIAAAAVARTVEQMLSSLGYCVVVRTDARDALMFLDTNAEDVDVILLDVDAAPWPVERMIRQIARRCRRTPVVALGHGSPDRPLPRHSRRVVAVLEKQPAVEPLAHAVRAALDALRTDDGRREN